jgi:hypothetical protein
MTGRDVAVTGIGAVMRVRDGAMTGMIMATVSSAARMAGTGPQRMGRGKACERRLQHEQGNHGEEEASRPQNLICAALRHASIPVIPPHGICCAAPSQWRKRWLSVTLDIPLCHSIASMNRDPGSKFPYVSHMLSESGYAQTGRQQEQPQWLRTRT